MLTSHASLEIGFWGNFQNKRYQIIGANMWRFDYREYFESEESRGYKQADWECTEWILRTEAGEFAYLVEDSKGFWFSQPFTARNATLPEVGIDMFADFTGAGAKRIKEFGTMNLAVEEGENGTGAPEPKQKYYFMYEDNGKQYGVEFPINEQRELVLEEASFSVASRMKFSEVTNFFSENPTVKKAGSKQKFVSTFSMAALILGAVFMFTWLVGSDIKDTVLTHQLEASGDATVMPSDTQRVELYSPTWKAVAGASYRAVVEGKVLVSAVGQSSQVHVLGSLVESDGSASDAMDDFLWTETGTDEGEPWVESNQAAKGDFSADKDGDAYVWLTVSRQGDTAASNMPLKITIERHYFDMGNLFYPALLLLIVGGIMRFYVRR